LFFLRTSLTSSSLLLSVSLYFVSRSMISGLMGNSSDFISSKSMMSITNSSMVSGLTIASSCSTAHIACGSTRPSSLSERGSSLSFSSRDSASANMLFFPAMWTKFGPYASYLVILSFDCLPYNICKWSVCTITF
jgi:hypothetical protein